MRYPEIYELPNGIFGIQVEENTLLVTKEEMGMLYNMLEERLTNIDSRGNNE